MRKQVNNNVYPARIVMSWILIFVLALMPERSWGEENSDEPPTKEVSNMDELQAALNYKHGEIIIKNSFTITSTVNISHAVQMSGAGLSCDPEHNFPLFSIGSGGALTLNSVYLTGGGGTQVAPSFSVSSGGSLVLDRCKITRAGNVSVSGQMTMNGSVISGNNMVNVCAGVFVGGGSLTIANNSRIEGNTTTLTDYKNVHTLEAGVTVNSGSVTLSGEVRVSDNKVNVTFPNLNDPIEMSSGGIFLSKGKTLDIGSMSGNSQCGVSLEDGHSGVFTAGKATEAHLNYFTSVYADATKHNKVALENGNLKMLPMDWHDYLRYFAKFSEIDLEISERSYTVKTAKGLAWAAWLEKIMVERSLYSGNPPIINIYLNNDLDLKTGAEEADLVNTDWMPFVKLYGNLHGEGHTLSNVVMKKPEDWVVIGGTGFISNLDGTVSNLSLTGLELEVSDSKMGGFGGIVGVMTSGTIENSSCTGKIQIDVQNYTTPINVGGIAGAFYSRANIKSCWSDVEMVVTHSGGVLAGGILGKSNSCQYSSGISNCYSTGSVSVTSSGTDAECCLGGIVGSGQDITIKSSYSVTPVYVEAQNGAPMISVGGIAGSIAKVKSENGGASIVSCLAINDGEVNSENAALYAKTSSAGVLNIHRIVGTNNDGTLDENCALNKLFMKSEAGSMETTHTASEVFLAGKDGAVWTHQLTAAPFKDWNKENWNISTSGERHLPLLKEAGYLLPNQTQRTFPNPFGLIGIHFKVGEGEADTIPNFAEADTIYRILLPNNTPLPLTIALTGTNDNGTDKDVINIQMTDSTVAEVLELVISNGDTKKFKVIFTIAPAELPSKPILPDLPSMAEEAPSHPVASIPDENALPEGIDKKDVELVSLPAKPSKEQQEAIDKALSDKGSAVENAIVMDISLMVKKGDIYMVIEPVAGKSIDILIPYPTGTDMKDAFTFLHLLSDNTIEEITPENTPAGLKLRVSSFSLFILVHTKADNPDPTPPYVPPVISTYYTVTLPSVEGVTLSRKSGNYTVEEGYSFSFALTLDEGYGQSQPVVKANGTEITPRQSDGKYVIRNVEEDIQVTIEGIVKNDPTANTVIESGNRIYALRSTVYIERLTPVEVQVLTIGGRVVRSLHLASGSNQVTGLQPGVYLIRLSDGQTEKVSVR